MTKKQAPKTNKFTRPSVVDKPTVSGGLLTKPSVLSLSGPGGAYVQLLKLSPWLCGAAAGKTYSLAPLSRTKWIETLKSHLDDEPEEQRTLVVVVDKMADLMSARKASHALAAKGGKASRGREKGKTPAVEIIASLPCKWAKDGAENVPWRLWRPANAETVWLHKDDVAMAIQYLHDEWAAKGVARSSSAEGSDDGSDTSTEKCFFDRRDWCWQGRVRGDSGEIHRITRAVPTRRKGSDELLTGDEFLKTKAEVAMEVRAWLAAHRTT